MCFARVVIPQVQNDLFSVFLIFNSRGPRLPVLGTLGFQLLLQLAHPLCKFGRYRLAGAYSWVRAAAWCSSSELKSRWVGFGPAVAAEAPAEDVPESRSRR